MDVPQDLFQFYLIIFIFSEIMHKTKVTLHETKLYNRNTKEPN